MALKRHGGQFPCDAGDECVTMKIAKPVDECGSRVITQSVLRVQRFEAHGKKSYSHFVALKRHGGQFPSHTGV